MSVRRHARRPACVTAETTFRDTERTPCLCYLLGLFGVIASINNTNHDRKDASSQCPLRKSRVNQAKHDASLTVGRAASG